MIRWLLKTIVGYPAQRACVRNCQWEIYDRSASMKKRGDEPEQQVAIIYTLRCTTCGDLKDHRSGI